MGEGFLRATLEQRSGNEAPMVTSAGTIGWDGAPAVRESIEVAFERGIDIAGHQARRLVAGQVVDADLIVGMTTEHRDAAVALLPQAVDRSFSLKEVVRLLESVGPVTEGQNLSDRIAAAAAARAAGFVGLPDDEDIVDPLNMPLATYRAVAWEIDQWVTRLADGIYGPTPSVGAGSTADVRGESS